MLMVAACHKSGNNDYAQGYKPSPVVLESFSAMFQSDGNPSWQKKGDYEMANFMVNSDTSVAWFAENGYFIVSYSTQPVTSLPVDVTKALTDNLYSLSDIHSVRLMKRNEFGSLYMVTLTLQNGPVTVVITEQGEIFKTVASYKFEASVSVSDTISKVYRKAQILEYDLYSDNSAEVDIVDSNIIKRMFLTDKGAWFRSYWQISESKLPTAITNTITSGEAYKGYSISQILYTQYPGMSYYHILFSKSGSAGFTVNFNADGTVVAP